MFLSINIYLREIENTVKWAFIERNYDRPCVGPENIRTPPTEGIGNFRTVGWGLRDPKLIERNFELPLNRNSIFEK